VTKVPREENSYYKYYVGYGNNCEIIKRIMETRDWWKEASANCSIFNFKWMPVNDRIKYDRLNIGVK